MRSVSSWGLVVLLLSLAACSSFTAADSSDAGDAQAGDAVSPTRTAVQCGDPLGTTPCNVGDHCCRTPDAPDTCSATCAANTLDYACGRASDCGEGLVCCGMQNGGSSCGGRLFTSACVPAANCLTCGDAGGMEVRLCDPSSATDCLAGATCTFTPQSTSYTACSF